MLLSEIIQEMGLHDKPITDYTAYNKGMRKGMADKAFFLKRIKPDFVLDFGCADGALVQYIRQEYPHIQCAGYDISPAMESHFKENNPDTPFFTNIDEAKKYASQFRSPCVLLSSVIHEVYSYGNSKSVSKFWKDIFGSDFEYVVIRDTIPKGIDSVKDYKNDVAKVKKLVDPHLLQDYEARWGTLESSYRNFIRFLLVYRYKDHWERESFENYLPLTYNTLVRKIPESYRIIYDKSFKFHPVASDIAKKYDVTVRKDTHLKMILRKK